MAKAKKKVEEVTEVVDTVDGLADPVATEEGPKLTVQDIRDLLTVVDAACKRGAFQAGEMATVGTLYNRVKGFVDAVEPQTQGETPAPAAE